MTHREVSDPGRAEILVFEPLVEGFSHSKLNAGLVSMLVAAFPNDVVRFHAESRHLATVRDAVPDEAKVTWHAMRIPPYDAPEGPRRIAGEIRWLREFHRGLRRRPRLALICSYSQLSLAFTKLLLRFGRSQAPVYGIIHSILTSIGEPPRRGIFRRFLSPAVTLRWKHPANLRHLALGPSVLSSVRMAMPSISDQFDCIPKPWLWPARAPVHSSPPSRDDIVFGIVGGQNGARLDEAGRIASMFRALRPDSGCRFTYVGSAPSTMSRPLETLLSPIPETVLSDQEFGDRLAGVTYVLGLNQGLKYDFVASGAFHDALAFGKPAFHLATAYARERVHSLGDVGEVRDTVPELVKTLVEAYDGYDPDRYAHQRDATLRAAEIHAPSAVAPLFRELYRARFGDWAPADGHRG